MQMSRMGHLSERRISMKKNDLFLLNGLLPGEKERCWQQTDARPLTVEKGEIICIPAQSQPSLIWILEGKAQIYQEEACINDLRQGDLFGAAALFGEASPIPHRLVAVSRCQILYISQKTVSSWMALYPRVAENYVRFLSDRIRFLDRRLSALTAGSAEEKLWRYLTDNRDEQHTVHLPDRMAELADTLNMGRSSLYRSLESLERAGWICRRGKDIILLQEQKEK